MTFRITSMKRSSPRGDIPATILLVGAFLSVPLGVGCTMAQDFGSSQPSAPAVSAMPTAARDNSNGFGNDLTQPVAGRAHVCPLSAPDEGAACTTENSAPCTYPAIKPELASRASFYVCGVKGKWIHFEDSLVGFDARSCAPGASCSAVGLKCNKPCAGLGTVQGCVETCACNGESFECTTP